MPDNDLFRFEIINPHDPYEMTAPDMRVAAVAIMFLGAGLLGLKGRSGARATDVPVFFSRASADEWFMREWGVPVACVVSDVMATRREDLAQAIESVVLLREECSSTRDLASEAQRLAERLRGGQ